MKVFYFQRMSAFSFLCFLFLLLITACHKDEDYLPPLFLDIATVQTNSEGRVVEVRTDNGKIYPVKNKYLTDKPLSMFRANLLLERQGGDILVSRCVPVYTVNPQIPPLHPTPNHPFLIRSVWCSGGYLNFNLALSDAPEKATKYLGVFYKGQQAHANGTKTLGFEVYYNTSQKVGLYTSELKMSCDIRDMLPELSTGDSISVVNVQAEGYRKITFPYPF